MIIILFILSYYIKYLIILQALLIKFTVQQKEQMFQYGQGTIDLNRLNQEII